MRKLALSLLLLTVGSVACASSHGGAPIAFSETDVPREPGPSSNWSLPADRAEAILRSAPYEIRVVQGAGAGVTGARKVDLLFEFTEQEEDEVYLWEFDEGVTLKAKPFPSPEPRRLEQQSAQGDRHRRVAEDFSRASRLRGADNGGPLHSPRTPSLCSN